MVRLVGCIIVAVATWAIPASAQPVPPPSPWIVSGSTVSPSGLEVLIPASTTAQAGINLAPGVAPTSPVNGDLWTTSGGLFARIGGATYSLPLSAASSVGNYSGDSTLTITGTGSGPWTGAVTIKCTVATASQIGCGEPDNATLQVSAGVWSLKAAPLADITGLGSGVATALGNAAGGSGGFALQSSLASYLPLAGGTLTGALTVSSASFGLSGSISTAGWGTNGVRYKNAAATLTDTTDSGTVATMYTDVWGGNTIAASSAMTVTNYFGSYFKAPVAGANVTLTNIYALGADSLYVGGNAVMPGLPTSGTIGYAVCATSGGSFILHSGTPCFNVAASSIAIGSTTVTSGNDTSVLYQNGASPSGTVGEYAITGTGNVVMSASPVLTGTPSINASGASLPSLIYTGADSGPWLQFSLSSGSNTSGLQINGSSGGGKNGFGPMVMFVGNGGTVASPAAQYAGTMIGGVMATGYNGSAYPTIGTSGGSTTPAPAAMLMVTYNAWTTSDNSTAIEFYTTPAGTVANSTLAATIGNDQSLTVAGAISASNLSLAAKLTTTGTGAPTFAFPSSAYTYTFPSAASTLAYLTSTPTSGHCVEFSGTAGLLADTGSACGGGSSTITAGSTPTSGFSAGQFLYSDGTDVQATGGVSFGGTGQMTLALGTITANATALALTGTTNNSGVSFGPVLSVNLTNSPSTAASGPPYIEAYNGSTLSFKVAPNAVHQYFDSAWGSNASYLNAFDVGSDNSNNHAFFYASASGATGDYPDHVPNSIGLSSGTASSGGTWIISADGTIDFVSGGYTFAYDNARLTGTGGFVLGNALLVSGTTILGTDPGAGNILIAGQLREMGSSTGYVALANANAGGSNYTATLPANTGTLSELNLAQTFTATQTIALGSVTSSQQALDITATFDAAAVFTAPLLENITNTSSSAGSKIADLQVGGVSVLSVSVSSPSTTLPTMLVNGTGAAPSSLTYSASDVLDVQGGSVSVTRFGSQPSFLRLANIGTSAASPSASTNNLGQLYFSGYNSSSLVTGAQISASVVTSPWTTSDTSAHLRFYTTATGTTILTEQMDLSASGGLSLGSSVVATDAGAGNFLLSGSITAKGIAADTGQTDATLCVVTSTGQFYYGTGTLGICLGTSSLRYKHDVRPLDVGLAQIAELQPISYELNAGHGDDPNHLLYGFSAEQGGSVLPALMGRDAEGRPNTFDYLGVVPVIVNAVQQIVDSCRAAANDNFCKELLKRVAAK